MSTKKTHTNNSITIRQQLMTDIHRPRYHFLPPQYWTNDPNGVIQWEEQYHLFYQYNPSAPIWGNMHWGHAVSADLIHWTDLPIALSPTPGGYDEAGIFSGCAVNNDGVPTIIYTSTRGMHNEIQTQSIATSSDDLLTWEKFSQNPILRDVPPESGQTRDFRDPFVWKEEDTWYMVLGSRIQDVGGAVFLYRSSNLLDWEYLHPLLIGDIQRNGVIWECPNFFPLGDKWVLIVSCHTGVMTNEIIYFVGTYKDLHFTPEYEATLDNASLYAPLTMLDDQNRRLMFGWVREDRPISELEKAGWAGAQSIPRVLTLDDHNRIRMTPVPELAAIRGKFHHQEQVSLPDSAVIAVNEPYLDIDAQFVPQEEGECGIAFVFSPVTHEGLEILFEAASQQLIVRQMVLDESGTLTTQIRQISHKPDRDTPRHLRILLDGSVVEIIADGHTSLTSRIYPSTFDGIQVHLIGSNTVLQSLDVWEMASIWQ